MAREPLHCDSCEVGQSAACAALGELERRQFARHGHRRELKRGECLFSAADDNDLTATLIKGVLKVTTFDEDGTEHILSLIHPADFAGELFESRVHHNIIALTDCAVCVFERSEYERALTDFPQFGRCLLQRASHELVETRSRLAAVTSRSATQRIAGFLLGIGRVANEAECHPALEFDVVLTRGEIASLLGLTIETVSRQLSKLEKDGVIRRKGLRRILLLDCARLERLAA